MTGPRRPWRPSVTRLASGPARAGIAAAVLLASSARSSSPTRSATSPSTTTRASASSRIACSSTSSSTRRRSRRSRRRPGSTTATARRICRRASSPGCPCRGASTVGPVAVAVRRRAAGAADPDRRRRHVPAGQRRPRRRCGWSCGFEAAVPIGSGTPIAFRDDFQAARIGWREMTAVGSGTTVLTPGVPADEHQRPPHRLSRLAGVRAGRPRARLRRPARRSDPPGPSGPGRRPGRAGHGGRGHGARSRGDRDRLVPGPARGSRHLRRAAAGAGAGRSGRRRGPARRAPAGAREPAARRSGRSSSRRSSGPGTR